RRFRPSHLQRLTIVADGCLWSVPRSGLFSGTAIPLGSIVHISGQLIMVGDEARVLGDAIARLLAEPAGDGPMEVSLAAHEHALVGNLPQERMFECVFLRAGD